MPNKYLDSVQLARLVTKIKSLVSTTVAGYLPLSGGSINGNLSVSGTITGDVTGTASGNLPLSGGTMTGTLYFNTGGEARIQNNLSTNDGFVSIYGGGGYTNGAYITLSGKDRSTNAGVFSIYANDGVNGTKSLQGKSDGTLTWNGKSIPERSYGISLVSTAGENTYTFSCNTNGAVVFAKRGANVSVHMVDYWTAGSVKLFSAGTDPITITKSANSNSVTITNTYSSAVAIKILNGGNL